MARSVEDQKTPTGRTEKQTDEIDADESGEPLPADGESGIDHLPPAEMNDEDGGDRKPNQRANDQTEFHESAAR